MGWFFGFKLHLVIDEKGEIMNAQLTAGNTDDKTPVDELTSRFQGVIFGDKGYVSKDLFAELFREKILLRKRSIIETVFGYMKNTRMLEHSRHRSQKNFLIRILATVITYQPTAKKSSISPISV